MSVDEEPDTKDRLDRWDLFWSEYMVWSLRLACYASNEYFFASIRISLQAGFPSIPISPILLIYSMASLWLIEKLFAQRYNPSYDYLSLTGDERDYRVSRERLIYSCALFSAGNFLLGALSSMAFSNIPATVAPIAYGAAGMFVTIVAVFVGVICLVGRNSTSGQRMPYLYPVGIIAFLVPSLFILLTVKNLVFRSQAVW